MAESDNWKAIVAIDFGTKYSGYGYQVRGDDAIETFTDWKRAGGYTNYKTPTVLLLDPDREFIAFGSEAIDKHDRMAPSDQKECYFFTDFKMNLYKELLKGGQLNANFALNATSGSKLAAVKVFSESLRFLKKHFIENFEVMRLTVEQIRWVITVPAIWEDAAKHFMRNAAHKAGMIDNVNSEKLIIALEPEAAGLLCRNVKTAQYKKSKGGIALPTAGDTYLVIDVGGGTVDLAAMEIVDETRLKQLHYAVGGPHGGGAVDQKFIQTLYDIFTEHVIVKFSRAYPAAYHKFLSNFEFEKRNFDNETSLRVSIPREFYELLSTETIENDLKRYKEKTGHDVSIQGSCLDVPVSLAMEFFQQVVDDIVKCTKRVYKELAPTNKIKVFFLVGGFADCALLKRSLEYEFPSVHVRKPREPGLSVVKGAVMFAANTSVVTARRFSRSYGTSVGEIYDERKHGSTSELEKKGLLYIKKGMLYRSGVYHKFVEKDTEVKLGEIKELSLSPNRSDTDSFGCLILSSTSSDTCYVEDDLCTVLGRVDLARKKFDDSFPSFTLKLQFGGTEIKASIVEHGCSNEVTKTINYFK